MTDAELRENLFKLLFPYSDIKREPDNELIGQILVLVKEWYKEAGYVQLAEDQSLPTCAYWSWSEICADPKVVAMLKAGFRKVELEVKE